MHKEFRKKLILLTGIFFILLGLIGLALPFLQGFLFLAIGLILLSLHSPNIRIWMDVHTKRYPKLHTLIKKLEESVIGVVGKP